MLVLAFSLQLFSLNYAIRQQIIICSTILSNCQEVCGDLRVAGWSTEGPFALLQPCSTQEKSLANELFYKEVTFIKSYKMHPFSLTLDDKQCCLRYNKNQLSHGVVKQCKIFLTFCLAHIVKTKVTLASKNTYKQVVCGDG